ncbi:MAG TPA: hypothetical protein VOB72_14425 [Candidatus Dormibacteraeota bacterium]|nr:hypothetical protein [Candidatus Dormibacteraeota bacterium]
MRTIIGVAAAVLFLAAGCQQSTTSTASVSPKPSNQPSSLAERAKKSAQPTSNPVRNASKAPTPAPKPLPSGPSLSAVYASSLQIDAQHLIAANGARTTSCATTRDLPGCRTALQQVASAAGALQKDLDAHPAPACLKAADTTLRSAVDLFQQGAQMGTQGIDQGSTAKLAQGRTLLDQATTRLLSASSQLGQAACTVPPPNVAP